MSTRAAVRLLWVICAVSFGLSSLNAQAVRFDSVSSTTSAQCVSGKICPLNAIPGTQVNVCGGTVSTMAPCLASPATTYTSATAGTPCATTSQLTPQTGGACLSTSDNQGNFGFWISPGSYSYFLRVPATAGGGTYGPYPVSVGASAGCPLGAVCDANYATVALACAAAGTGTLYFTRHWNSLTTQSACATAQATFLGNDAVLQPASGQTVTINLQSAPLAKICDISLGGTCVIKSPTGVIEAEWFGAKPDNSTNSKAAIDAALAQSQPLQLETGTYLYPGKLTSLTGTAGKQIRGRGVEQTTLSCTDSTQTACIEITGTYTQQLTFSELAINGPGMGAGTNMHGIYSHGGPPKNSLTLDNVWVRNFSGDGVHMEDWFMTRYYNVWAQNVGGSGIYSNGDQSATFINSGAFVANVGKYCWDVGGGAPFMQGMNCGDGIGLGGAHFGTLSPANYAHPVIMGMNIESCNTAGCNGIYFEPGSEAAFINGGFPGLQLYCDTAACGYPIYWAQIDRGGYMAGEPFVFEQNGGTWTTPYFFAANVVLGASLLMNGVDPTHMNSTLKSVTTDIRSCTGKTGVTFSTCFASAINTPGITNSGGPVYDTPVTKTAGYTLTASDSVVRVDATSGTVVLLIGTIAAFPAGQKFTITRVDSSTANFVQLSASNSLGPYGTTMYLTVAGESVTIESNGSTWDLLAHSGAPWISNYNSASRVFADLPSCPSSSRGIGTISPMYISNSSTATQGAIAAGGGSSGVLVACNPNTGNWLVLSPWSN